MLVRANGARTAYALRNAASSTSGRRTATTVNLHSGDSGDDDDSNNNDVDQDEVGATFRVRARTSAARR